MACVSSETMPENFWSSTLNIKHASFISYFNYLNDNWLSKSKNNKM